MSKRWFAAPLLSLALSGAAVPALAAGPSSGTGSGAISGLYNTGEGVAAGEQDYNYVFEVLSGSAPAGNSFGYAASNYPSGSWLGNDGVSQWLTPTADGGQSYDVAADGSYKWTLQFDLSGYDAASASLVGRIAADNGAQVLLNGHLLGASDSFASWSSFSASGSDFVAGMNTFEFIVTNQAGASGNPTGLRVEFLSSYVNAVPEPSTWAMMLAGLLATGTLARRRARHGD